VGSRAFRTTDSIGSGLVSCPYRVHSFGPRTASFMPRTVQPARVVKWRRGQWYLFYTDSKTGTQVRERCESLRASTPEQRRALVQKYRKLEFAGLMDQVAGGSKIAALDAVLATDIDAYLSWLAGRKAARIANPQAREGLSPKSCRLAEFTINRFRSWISPKLTTGQLDRQTLERYLARVSSRKFYRRAGMQAPSAATMNLERRNLKACLRWINELRPARFHDFPVLVRALKPVPEAKPTPQAFTPEQLRSFLERSRVEKHPVTRVRHGKQEVYTQKVRKPATPVDRLFLLLALTGCRLGEALALKWQDVDLARGLVTLYSQKTGHRRWLPLAGAKEGEVAPSLLEIMRGWKKEARTPFVLPGKPQFPKGAWLACGEIMPQDLRQNFTSYAASMGVPASVAAQWQGHSVGVAERYYRAQVPCRNPGTSIDEAMGLGGKKCETQALVQCEQLGI
jgi:integrase